MSFRLRACTAAFALPLILGTKVFAIPLDPVSFDSLGTLDVSAGTVAINTGTVVPTLTIGTTTFKGVLQSQGAGLPDVAVFAFDRIRITGSAVISGQGNRPLALLSQSDATITSPIDISAVNGDGGAFGGAAHDAGPGNAFTGTAVSPGGGFGGKGGDVVLTFDQSVVGAAGGSAYGNLAVALQAGSGGSTGTEAGGGGGAIEIGARGTVTVGSIRSAGGNGTATRNGTVSSGGGSGGGILLHGATVSATSVDARGGSTADAVTAAGSGGGGGRILLMPDTFTLDASVGTGNVQGGTGGNARTVTGLNGQSGTFEVRPGTTDVLTGQVLQAGANGRMVLPSGATLIPGNVIVHGGGALVATHPYTTSGLLTLQGGSALTALSTLSVTHAVEVGGGAGVTAIGVTDATAPIQLLGGTFAALGGLKTSSEIGGSGSIVGPVSGGASSQLRANGGTLTVGDANRTDGFLWNGTLRVVSSHTSPGTLRLDSAAPVVLGTTLLEGPGARLVTLNGAQLASGAAITATDSSRISSAFRNDGAINGPVGNGQFLAFDGAVSGTGSFSGNVRFEGGLSPGASPALQQVGTVVFAPTNTLHMELGGHVRGTEYDAIDAVRSITLDGLLEVVLLDPFVPGAGNVFDLLSATHITGSFASQVLPALGAGLSWHTAILSGQTGDIFRLTVAAVPEPAEWMLIAAGGALLAARRRRA